MIYFDNNATTPLHPTVFEAMRPWFTQQHANASSLHQGGRAAHAAIDEARAQVAALVGVEPQQVIFTSGGTEADNLAIKGMTAHREPGRLLFSATEHDAVAQPARALRHTGWQVDELAVDDQGRVDRAALSHALAAGVDVLSVMAANNETGVLQDVAAIAEQARARGALVHTDAVQAVGKTAFDFNASGAHCASLSAHKIQGPKGVGALIVDKQLDIEALLHGGGHERGLRAGTYNTPGIVGLGAAAARVREQGEAQARHMHELRVQLEAGLDAIGGITRFSAAAERLPNTCQFSVPGYDGESLLMLLDRHDIAVSPGSACAAGTGEPSPVLMAMGVDETTARGAVRVSLGADNTAAEVTRFIDVLKTLAGQSPQPALGGINPSVLMG